MLNINKKPLHDRGFLLVLSDPAGARTQDPILKRDVLYLLSYGIVKGLQNYCFYLYMQIIFSGFFSDICNGLK